MKAVEISHFDWLVNLVLNREHTRQLLKIKFRNHFVPMQFLVKSIVTKIRINKPCLLALPRHRKMDDLR